MDLKYIRAIIVLVAALITSIYDIYAHIPVNDSLIRLFIVLLIFYMVGTIVIKIIRKVNIKADEMAAEAEAKRLEEERIAKEAEEIDDIDENGYENNN